VFTPDGEYLVSAGGLFVDAEINIWHVDTQKLIESVRGHTKSVTNILISPNGKLMISTSYDGTILVWELSQ
jgi:WD40 repeat protein